MNLKNDIKLNIAVGASAKSKAWKNKSVQWVQLAERLTTANHTTETYKEFMRLSKTDQGSIKDVGGFVGGYLRGSRRKPENVVNRQLVTLDIDYGTLDFWDLFTMFYDCAAVIHGTHKHTDETPKYRLVIPLDREVTPDEYVAISRQIAGTLYEGSIELFDPTTFQPERLMFWPSTPKDLKFYSEIQDGAFLSADEVLNTYQDWTDTTLWPTMAKAFDDVKRNVCKQEDPLEKTGVIGAFCRTYTIGEAIETFLEEDYVNVSGDRYTYLKGSAAGGMITYDDKFAYSHHGTDPSGGQLCNAFDLVRLHKFGHLDDKARTNNREKLASFKKMEALILSDTQTKRTIAQEKFSSAQYDFNEDNADEAIKAHNAALTDAEIDALLFSDEEEDEADEYEPGSAKADFADYEPGSAKADFADSETPVQKKSKKKKAKKEVLNLDWMQDLEVDSKLKYLSSSNNINLILANDDRLKNAFMYNSFDAKRYACKSLPWRKIAGVDEIKDVDYSGIRNYLECIYGISGTMKIDDALALEFEKRSFHPVKDYLDAAKWDGVPRIHRFLQDFYGAENDAYHREALKKSMCAAVARIYEPGTKFDLVLTLVGGQGTKKSTMISKLGGAWSSDSFNTVKGNAAFEQLQGKWLIEMAELSGLRKADVETVKHFITKQDDYFRPAYARTAVTFKRQCVFFATTNKREFLNDPSGNRRFMPIDVQPRKATREIFDITDEEITLMWAEAVQLWRDGETLYLSAESEKIANKERKSHSEMDERIGLIESYLDLKMPSDWDTLDIYERRSLANGLTVEPDEGEMKDFVCVAEIWAECMGKEKEDMDRYKTREINDMLRGLEGWEQSKSTKNFKLYGKQKYYSRIKD